MSEPEAPKGVTATMPDGEVLTATLTFLEFEDGQAVWHAEFDTPEVVPLSSIRIAELPPFTTVRLSWVGVDADA